MSNISMFLLSSPYWLILFFIVHPALVKTLDCPAELGQDGDGRYVQLIANNFPVIPVFADGDKKNIFCKCKTFFWMVCFIYRVSKDTYNPFKNLHLSVPMLVPGSEAWDVREGLRKFPFTTIPGVLANVDQIIMNPFLFAIPHVIPFSVFAEIRLVYGPQKPRHEMEAMRLAPGGKDYVIPYSSIFPNYDMWPSGFPDHFIGISRCDCGPDTDEPNCPVFETDFNANDVVWILKSSMEDDISGKVSTIPCISNDAMEKLVNSPENLQEGGFKDPLDREEGKLLQQYEHYQAFIAIDDSVNPDIAEEDRYLSSEDYFPSAYPTNSKDGASRSVSDVVKHVTLKLDAASIQERRVQSTKFLSSPFLFIITFYILFTTFYILVKISYIFDVSYYHPFLEDI